MDQRQIKRDELLRLVRKSMDAVHKASALATEMVDGSHLDEYVSIIGSIATERDLDRFLTYHRDESDRVYEKKTFGELPIPLLKDAIREIILEHFKYRDIYLVARDKAEVREFDNSLGSNYTVTFEGTLDQVLDHKLTTDIEWMRRGRR